MAKKNFKNPAEIFISDAEQETQKHEKTKNEIQEEYIPPKGFKLVKESKTERMQLLVRPATKAAIKQESLKQGISMNDLINQILDQYIERNIEA